MSKKINSIKDKYYNNRKPNCKVERYLGLTNFFNSNNANQNLLLGWNPHDLETRTTLNRCILHRLPTILWNRSGFHKLQHSTTCLWNLLEKLWQNHPQIVLTGYFFHHVFGHSSLAFWAWYVTLSWPSSQSTLVFQF